MVGGEVFQMWLATLSRPEGSVRSSPSGPKGMVGGTIFEMWLGALWSLAQRSLRGVRASSGGAKLTVGRTIFELWLGL